MALCDKGCNYSLVEISGKNEQFKATENKINGLRSMLEWRVRPRSVERHALALSKGCTKIPNMDTLK